jgi:bifunctional non-homologous end joining protein LigD
MEKTTMARQRTMKSSQGNGAATLADYQAKRNFGQTPEPTPRPGKPHRQPIFVVQEHHASRLHYDFRLEADGVLMSWVIPREPSLDPAQKRLAVHVEDHPLDYANFEGTIPEGQYGAGTVTIWDQGTYENLLADKPVPQTVAEGIASGRLEFVLHGNKLRGRFALIRMKGKGRGKDNWLLIKMKDDFAHSGKGDPKPARTARGRAATESSSSTRRDPPASSSAETGVAITHPDKVWFPDAGITKGDVLNYYQRIAKRLLPFLRDRPITLERLPDGLGPDKPHFWQKNTPPYYPDWIPRVELPTERGKTVPYALVNDLRTLLYLVHPGRIDCPPGG